MSKTNKKEVTFSLKLSASEADVIKLLAAQKSKSVSAFIRDSIFEGADFKKFRKENQRKSKNNHRASAEINPQNSSDFENNPSQTNDVLLKNSTDFENKSLTTEDTKLRNDMNFKDKKSSDKGISFRKNLYFSPKEYEIITTNAQICGRTFNAYIKECALKGGIYQFDFSEIHTHTTELSQLSEIINLLTESIISADKIYDYQLETIVHRMDDILESERCFLADMRKLYKKLDKKIQKSFSAELKKGEEVNFI